jgi:hypothetical protein
LNAIDFPLLVFFWAALGCYYTTGFLGVRRDSSFDRVQLYVQRNGATIMQRDNQEQEYDPLWLEETREKIAIGLAQIENGQVLDGKAVIEQLREKVRQRASWEHFQPVLVQVPDVEPEEFDRL